MNDKPKTISHDFKTCALRWKATRFCSVFCSGALALLAWLGGLGDADAQEVGATVPWVRYEAEDCHLLGGAKIEGPSLDRNTFAVEATNRKCVRLTAAGDGIRFTVQKSFSALVIRLSMPDADKGGGTEDFIQLTAGANTLRLPLTSKYAWLYGDETKKGQLNSNEPPEPGYTGPFVRMRFDEARFRLPAVVPAGTVVEITKPRDAKSGWLVLDLVEVELVPPPIPQPAGYLSVAEFGAKTDGSDAGPACVATITAAREKKTGIYFPPGRYRLGNPLTVQNLSVQGAGIWETELSIEGARPRNDAFIGAGGKISVSDLSILGSSTTRSDSARGFSGWYGPGSRIDSVWIEHTEVGAWIGDYVGKNVTDGLTFSRCRVRNTYADGINFVRGTRNSIIEQCHFRGNMDDSVASWSSDAKNCPPTSRNIFRYNTIENTLRAGGVGLFGGEAHQVHHNLIRDTFNEGGIRFSCVFPGHPFGATEPMRIYLNQLVRCGGLSNGREHNGAIDLCSHPNLGELRQVWIKNNTIIDSAYSGIHLHCGDRQGQRVPITGIVLEGNTIRGAGEYGIGIEDKSLGWLTSTDNRIEGTRLGEVYNQSDLEIRPWHYTLEPQAGNAPDFTSADFKKTFSMPPNEFRIMQYGNLEEKQAIQCKEYGIGNMHGGSLYNLLPSGKHPNPAEIQKRVDYARQQGFGIVLTDDYGYPSGSAGGKVVQENPAWEIRSLLCITQDGKGAQPVKFELPSGPERIATAVFYPLVNGAADFARGQVCSVQERSLEASGIAGPWRLCIFALQIRDRDTQGQSTVKQFGHTGHYPDKLNPAAMQRTIELMHGEFAQALPKLKEQVEGFYFNEPSLLQLHWNQEIPAPYAYLPWTPKLPETFKLMHGYDVMPRLGALFTGNDQASKRVRMHYEQTVAEMLRISYTSQIRKWCEAHGVLSEGHPLLEEYLPMHVANYGDMMLFMSEVNMPAFDIPLPEPDRMARLNYHFARIMTSVNSWKQGVGVKCLLDPIIESGMSRLSPSIPVLRNVVNMEYRHGVTHFSTYVPLEKKGDAAAGYLPQDYRTFNEYIGRIGLLLRGAVPETSVGIYYPIHDFQADYTPSNLFWTKSQARFSNQQKAWDDLQTSLLDKGIDYLLVHPQALTEATLKGDLLKIGRGSFHYLVMPPLEFVPPAALEKLKGFSAAGGVVLWVNRKPTAGMYPQEDAEVKSLLADAKVVTMDELAALIKQPYDPDFALSITPQPGILEIARFRQKDTPVYYLVNRTGNPLPVSISSHPNRKLTLYDPTNGSIKTLSINKGTNLTIEAYASVLLTQ